MRYSSGRLSSSPRTTKTRRWASNRGDDEEWIDHLGDRAWINWAPGVLPRSCKDRHDQGYDVDARRADEGSLGRHRRGRSLF
jgi:hypothetical protein